MFALYLYQKLMHSTTNKSALVSSDARALVGYKCTDHQHVKEYALLPVDKVSTLENLSNCQIPGQLIFKLKEGK